MTPNDEAAGSERKAASTPGRMSAAAAETAPASESSSLAAGAAILSRLALHHVAVVVADLDAAVARQVALGFGGAERLKLPEQGVVAATFPTGAGVLELIQPTDPDGPIGRFLTKRGEGLHHVAFRVQDLEATLAGLKSTGVRLIDEIPRRGAHGWRIAFVHPDACNGVLTELVEVRER